MYDGPFSFAVFVLFGTLCSGSLLLPQSEINVRVSPGRLSSSSRASYCEEPAAEKCIQKQL